MEATEEIRWEIVNSVYFQSGVGTYGYKIKSVSGETRIISLKTASRMLRNKKLKFSMFSEMAYLRVPEGYKELLGGIDLGPE